MVFSFLTMILAALVEELTAAALLVAASIRRVHCRPSHVYVALVAPIRVIAIN